MKNPACQIGYVRIKYVKLNQRNEINKVRFSRLVGQSVYFHPTTYSKVFNVSHFKSGSRISIIHDFVIIILSSWILHRSENYGLMLLKYVETKLV